jgi:hypothetical protein
VNLLTLAVAAILVSATDESPRSNVSASITYTAIERDGDIVTLSVRSGDPRFGRYYGAESFYYNDCHYYRHYPRRTTARRPVVFVDRPVYVRAYVDVDKHPGKGHIKRKGKGHRKH